MKQEHININTSPKSARRDTLTCYNNLAESKCVTGHLAYILRLITENELQVREWVEQGGSGRIRGKIGQRTLEVLSE